MSKLKFIILFICFFIYKAEKSLLFDNLLNRVVKIGKIQKMVVAGGDNENMLKCCRVVKDKKIADCILVGDIQKIKEKASKYQIDISDFELVNISDHIEIARYSVKLVHDGKANIYAKGSLHTKIIMKVALDKEIGLRTKNGFINIISIFEDQMRKKLLFMSDGGMVPYPTLDNKKRIIENTVSVAQILGIKNPKVAPLAAIEVVNPKMIETVEADELKKMNEKGIIKDCIVDGPLSLDLALDPEAARIKNIGDRKIQGDADIIIFPNIHSANIAYKLLSHFKGWRSLNVIVGTSAPILLTSRSDSIDTKIMSVAYACFSLDMK